MSGAVGAVRAFDNVAAVFSAADDLAGQTVKVTGQFVQEAGGTAHLADNTNVINSFAPSVVDSDWAITLRDNNAVRGLFEKLPSQGFSAGLDVRQGTVEITGTVSTEPRMMLSPPSRYVTIDVTDARVLPEPEMSGNFDDFGTIGGGFIS